MKEGVYFGKDSKGTNQFPEHPDGMKKCVDEWMLKMSNLGSILLRGIAMGLGLPADTF